MPSIFSKIISREISGYIVAEDDRFIAFLDIMPLVMGHTLVVPKKEVDYIFDLEDDVLAGISVFAKKVAVAVRSAVPCKRVGVAVVGLEVPHAHIHLVPLQSVGDINFTRPKLHPDPEQLRVMAEQIKAALAKA